MLGRFSTQVNIFSDRFAAFIHELEMKLSRAFRISEKSSLTLVMVGQAESPLGIFQLRAPIAANGGGGPGGATGARGDLCGALPIAGAVRG